MRDCKCSMEDLMRRGCDGECGTEEERLADARKIKDPRLRSYALLLLLTNIDKEFVKRYIVKREKELATK